MLPRAVRDELVRVAGQALRLVVPCPAPATTTTTAGTSRSTRTTATAASSRPAPAASSTPGSTTGSTIPGIDWQALAQDVDAGEGPDPSTSRYPASNASRKGSSRRR